MRECDPAWVYLSQQHYPLAVGPDDVVHLRAHSLPGQLGSPQACLKNEHNIISGCLFCCGLMCCSFLLDITGISESVQTEVLFLKRWVTTSSCFLYNLFRENPFISLIFSLVLALTSQCFAVRRKQSVYHDARLRLLLICVILPYFNDAHTVKHSAWAHELMSWRFSCKYMSVWLQLMIIFILH